MSNAPPTGFFSIYEEQAPELPASLRIIYNYMRERNAVEILHELPDVSTLTFQPQTLEKNAASHKLLVARHDEANIYAYLIFWKEHRREAVAAAAGKMTDTAARIPTAPTTDTIKKAAIMENAAHVNRTQVDLCKIYIYHEPANPASTQTPKRVLISPQASRQPRKAKRGINFTYHIERYELLYPFNMINERMVRIKNSTEINMFTTLVKYYFCVKGLADNLFEEQSRWFCGIFLSAMKRMVEKKKRTLKAHGEKGLLELMSQGSEGDGEEDEEGGAEADEEDNGRDFNDGPPMHGEAMSLAQDEDELFHLGGELAIEQQQMTDAINSLKRQRDNLNVQIDEMTKRRNVIRKRYQRIFA
ncbi:hypothetical protein GQ43DRAFT_469435 [Delitschia confertaspora ATCC 74209]|uniref:Uncharacterized protein n=1 Tax=Delitschia confertaspora ATCC 74209 TaxID=1513339 RepID=A0A9P4JWY2_9PLEO|nr:hypothetical protein GQ43DRAFT_469435 [Delitschia confertaspora ATCC 74209]